MNEIQNQKINRINKLTNILNMASNLATEKTRIIQNYKEKLILLNEKSTNEINNETINEFINKLSLLVEEENKQNNPNEENFNQNFNLNIDIYANDNLIENFSIENIDCNIIPNKNFIFILLFSILSKNNLGNLHTSLTKKITESYIYLKSFEDFIKNSIEQFEKIKFILNEKARPFTGNFYYSFKFFL